MTYAGKPSVWRNPIGTKALLDNDYAEHSYALDMEQEHLYREARKRVREKEGGSSVTKQSVSAAGDSPTNEESVRRLQDGDGSAPELLIRRNSGCLTALAIRYGGNSSGSSLTEDLKQEGAIALLEAAKRFDSAFGNRFLTYATLPFKRLCWTTPPKTHCLSPFQPGGITSCGGYDDLWQKRKTCRRRRLILRIMGQLGRLSSCGVEPFTGVPNPVPER